jgi:hypothetical protein
MSDLDLNTEIYNILIEDCEEQVHKLEQQITDLIIELVFAEKKIKQLLGEKEYITALKNGANWDDFISD